MRALVVSAALALSACQAQSASSAKPVPGPEQATLAPPAEYKARFVTTRGTFVEAPAEAELMYEPQSLGRSEAVSVTVQ